MRKYIRNYVEGGTYFFTLVTNDRKAIFHDPTSIKVCLDAINQIQKCHPFELVAFCFIPDHLHVLVTLPDGQKDYSTIIKEIKRKVTKDLRREHNTPSLIVWQKRFWERTIRDEHDFKIHFDYIHYNPIKHGFVENLDDWKWSSFSYYFGEKDRENAAVDPNIFPKDSRFFGE